MSDEELDDGFEDDADAPKKFAGKKIVLFIVLPILLLAGGGAGVVMSGLLDAGPETSANVAAASEESEPVASESVFYELPVLLVNLNSKSRRPSFLKLSVSLELGNPVDVPRIESLKPRIIDNFQVYLRELRADDLRGSAGIYRLREELLARVNQSVHPADVNDVLFKEVLVQ
jgi:flagellar FliL protein